MATGKVQEVFATAVSKDVCSSSKTADTSCGKQCPEAAIKAMLFLCAVSELNSCQSVFNTSSSGVPESDSFASVDLPAD